MSEDLTKGLRVVVLSYGPGGEYRPLLDSLAREGLDLSRVLLVHNPSVPGERPPEDVNGCEVVVASHNLGYAAGMNLGIERQLRDDTELLLLLTHDARLRPGALTALLAAARGNRGLGVLGPVLLLSGTATPYSFGGIRHPNGSVGHRRSPPPGGGVVAPCDWVDGGTMLIRAEALRRVGAFDARLWGYTEEAELCLRMTAAGFGVAAVLDARADQEPGAVKRPAPWAYLTTRNGLNYARRSAGARGLAFVAGRALMVIGYELLRAGARASRLRPGPVAEPWGIAVGMGRGIADYGRGRWGPPPTSLPGASDMSNLEAADGSQAAARPRVLHVGPDARGGMAAVLHGLFDSSLGERYQLSFLATHRGFGAVRRLAVFAVAVASLAWWTLRRHGRLVHIHATVRGSMYRKALYVLVAKLLGRRIVLHVHAGPGDIATFRSDAGRLRAAALRFALHRADVILSVSRASRDALEGSFGIEGIEVVPNAAPPVAATLPAHADPEPLAVFLGGFENKVKGGAELVAALALLEPGRPPLVLAGPGEPPPEAAEAIATRPRTEWRGWLRAPDREELLDAASIFILSSTSEGLPMALLEAMSRGMAIVATEVGGVPDVVADDVEALLVAPGDPAALAAAIDRLAGDPQLRGRLGAAAQRRAATMSVERVAERIDAIYRGLGA